MTTLIDTYHVPVLLGESIDGLAIRRGGVYIAGHARLRQVLFA